MTSLCSTEKTIVSAFPEEKFLTSQQKLDLATSKYQNDKNIIQIIQKYFNPTITHLNLSCAWIDNVSFLSMLENLTELNLQCMQMKNGELYNNYLTERHFKETPLPLCLKKLNLSSNKIKDISFLSDLTSLVELDLSFNSLQNLSVLENLTSLEKLNLKGTHIKDISFISKLISLKELNLWGTEISKISALSFLTNLQSLELGNCGMLEIDISFLASLTSLKQLRLRDMRGIEDVYCLSNLKSLTSLSLEKSTLTNFSSLSSLKSLTVLNLGDTSFDNVSLLTALTSLRVLILRNTHIKDVSPLTALTSLQTLYLNNTKVSDISCLKSLENLTHLDIGYTLSMYTNVFSFLYKNLPKLNIYHNGGYLHRESETYLFKNNADF
jgi:internalin A